MKHFSWIYPTQALGRGLRVLDSKLVGEEVLLINAAILLRNLYQARKQFEIPAAGTALTDKRAERPRRAMSKEKRILSRAMNVVIERTEVKLVLVCEGQKLHVTLRAREAAVPLF